MTCKMAQTVGLDYFVAFGAMYKTISIFSRFKK